MSWLVLSDEEYVYKLTGVMMEAFEHLVSFLERKQVVWPVQEGRAILYEALKAVREVEHPLPETQPEAVCWRALGLGQGAEPKLPREDQDDG
ncbi:MAG: hypothetical protein JNM34_10320 [Chthonomonadaceae bacterium]|nr:hypothetical protein [Chthonomonadaceae bacterium]